MVKDFFKQFRSDRGDSLVSAVIVLPLIIFLIFTAIDFSLYMGNRGMIQGIARDGARTAAIMGGAGNANYVTTIEKAYGTSRSQACSGLDAASGYKDNSAIECDLLRNLKDSKGLVNVQVNSVTCSPEYTAYIGQRVSCEVDWEYKGVGVSGLTFIDSTSSVKTTGTSESEVALTQSDLVPR